jgi:hypothetical protein
MTNGNGTKKTRPVRTIYYNTKHQPVQTNYAKYPLSATERCVRHMSLDDYGASSAEVIDTGDAAQPLHAVLRRTPKSMEILYKRDPVKYPLPKRVARK